MKKVFIVFGDNAREVESLIGQMQRLFTHQDCLIVYADRADINNALQRTLEFIHKHGDTDNTKNKVLYAGDNLTLLKDNVPCPCLDLTILRNKMVDAVGGDDTPLRKGTVGILFKGALLALLKDFDNKFS